MNSGWPRTPFGASTAQAPPKNCWPNHNHALAACPHLAATATHVTAFAEMMTGLHGDRLLEWMNTVDAEELPHLHSFTTGLRRDLKAVINGLTLPYSSGPVEGIVNKIIKRQMFGRANFDLLRKRVLLT